MSKYVRIESTETDKSVLTIGAKIVIMYNMQNLTNHLIKNKEQTKHLKCEN